MAASLKRGSKMPAPFHVLREPLQQGEAGSPAASAGDSLCNKTRGVIFFKNTVVG